MRIAAVPLALIRRPLQRVLDEAKVAALMESIAAEGQKEPIDVLEPGCGRPLLKCYSCICSEDWGALGLFRRPLVSGDLSRSVKAISDTGGVMLDLVALALSRAIGLAGGG